MFQWIFPTKIQTCQSKETGHIKCHVSGHYQNYGINIQAACNHRCQFVHMCVAVPGSANDIFALLEISITTNGCSTPNWKVYCVHVCSEHVLTQQLQLRSQSTPNQD